MEEIISSGVNLFFLTNPHAPSGLSFPKPEISKILNDLEAILVVDEAYADFADDTSISLLSEADNLIITRTFSKSYSLAGSRVGYAISSPQIIEVLDNVREVSGGITLADMQGGCFTITNGGIYGSLLSTPIINPPQSGILGMHTIQERPVVRNGEIVARPMMYLALSYDHRVVDGKEAVTFLIKIKEAIEEPARLALGI
jgi:hypothetical protein